MSVGIRARPPCGLIHETGRQLSSTSRQAMPVLSDRMPHGTLSFRAQRRSAALESVQSLPALPEDPYPAFTPRPAGPDAAPLE